MVQKSEATHGVAQAATRTLTERERLVLSFLRQFGPTSRAALIKATDLSGTAVFRVTEDLAAAGLVALGEPIRDGRGQPSNLVSLNPQSVFSGGVSIMTDRAEATLADLSGAIVDHAEVTAPAMERQATLDNALAFFTRALAARGASFAAMAGIGLAVAGFFVSEDTVNPAAELDDWALRNLRMDAEAVFAVPVIVENIANAAAIGEQLLGVGRQHGSFAYVSMSAGFGGGMILRGQPWRGAHGNAGEFAALLKEAGAPVPHLADLRDTLAAHGVATSDVNDLLERYDPMWPGLASWIGIAAAAIRKLSLLLHYSVDIDAVVIGGRAPADLAQRIAAAAAIDDEERRARIRRGAAHPSPVILPAQVSAHAAAVGAAAIPLARTYFKPLPLKSAMS